MATVGQYVICAGGYTNTVGFSNQVDMFNISNGGSWSTAKLSSPRFGIAAATLGNKAYFTGGGHFNLSTSFYNISYNRVDIFDAIEGKWSTVSLNQARMTHSCAAWGNKIAVGGGWRAKSTSTLGSVEILTDTSILSTDSRIVKQDFSLYPNPASGYLHLQFPDDNSPGKDAHLTIFDLAGKSCLSQQVNGQNEVVGLTGFQPGLYLLEVRDGKGSHFQKFIIQ